MCCQNLALADVLILRQVSRHYHNRVTDLLDNFPWEVRHRYPGMREDKKMQKQQRDIECGPYYRHGREAHHAYEWLKRVVALVAQPRVMSMVRIKHLNMISAVLSEVGSADIARAYLYQSTGVSKVLGT